MSRIKYVINPRWTAARASVIRKSCKAIEAPMNAGKKIITVRNIEICDGAMVGVSLFMDGGFRV